MKYYAEYDANGSIKKIGKSDINAFNGIEIAEEEYNQIEQNLKVEINGDEFDLIVTEEGKS